jgi:hypothetical protein
MMGMRDRAALAMARMDQVRREMSERRSLRQRNTQAVRAKAQEAMRSMRDRMPAMMETAKRAVEVAQHREQAGGWATTKTDRDRDNVMGFGVEEEAAGYRPPPPPAPAPAPGPRPFVPDDAEPDEQPAEPPRPAPPPPPRPVRSAPPARPQRPATELDDEDDFSNQSTWMRNQ